MSSKSRKVKTYVMSLTLTLVTHAGYMRVWDILLKFYTNAVNPWDICVCKVYAYAGYMQGKYSKSTVTLINHIYASAQSLISESGIVNLHLSDHYAVFCTLFNGRRGGNKICQFEHCQSFHHLNEFKLLNAVSSAPWSLIQAFEDINDILSNFNSIFLSIWDKHAPIKKRYLQLLQQPWMKGDIIKLLRSRDILFRRFLHSRKDALWLS